MYTVLFVYTVYCTFPNNSILGVLTYHLQRKRIKHNVTVVFNIYYITYKSYTFKKNHVRSTVREWSATPLIKKGI